MRSVFSACSVLWFIVVIFCLSSVYKWAMAADLFAVTVRNLVDV